MLVRLHDDESTSARKTLQPTAATAKAGMQNTAFKP